MRLRARVLEARPEKHGRRSVRRVWKERAREHGWGLCRKTQKMCRRSGEDEELVDQGLYTDTLWHHLASQRFIRCRCRRTPDNASVKLR